MKAPDRNTWMVLGALGIGGYLVYRLVQGLTNFNRGTPYEGKGAVGTAANVANQLTGGALSAVGSWGAVTLYNWTHPKDRALTAASYIIRFPDGRAHAIGANLINAVSRFKYNGVSFQVKADASGIMYAVPV